MVPYVVCQRLQSILHSASTFYSQTAFIIGTRARYSFRLYNVLNPLHHNLHKWWWSIKHPLAKEKTVLRSRLHPVSLRILMGPSEVKNGNRFISHRTSAIQADALMLGRILRARIFIRQNHPTPSNARKLVKQTDFLVTNRNEWIFPSKSASRYAGCVAL